MPSDFLDALLLRPERLDRVDDCSAADGQDAGQQGCGVPHRTAERVEIFEIRASHGNTGGDRD